MPNTLLQEINAEHPDYTIRKSLWRQYRDLYVGGERFRSNAPEYLARRQHEPFEVYGERLSRVFYENYIGSIIDWYVATLFRREPLLIVEGKDVQAKKFLAAFTEDCDLRGTSLTDFFRRTLLDAVICGTSYILVDFPRAITTPHNRAEEDRQGTSRAYLTQCPQESLINWNVDQRGTFEWVVLRNSYLQKNSFRATDWLKVNQWTYFDRERFEVYRQVDGDPDARLVDSGRHGMAGLRRVPVIPLRVSEGLWLMNRAALLQLEHFNKSNALGWALTQGLSAQPVVYSEREFDGKVGDSYFLQLGPQDRFGWTEPDGKVFTIATENLKRLQAEIYRVCYMQNQAGGSLVQSGLSKARDFAFTQEVLRAYGDAVKDGLKLVLRTIVEARRDELHVDISGLDEFDIGDFSGELADAQQLLGLGIDSPTLRTQVYKKLAFKYLCDVRQEVKHRIGEEIDQAMKGQ